MTEAERNALFESARRAVLDMIPDARAVYVFGSFARGDEWPASDLDLAVLLPPGRAAWNPLELTTAISLKTGVNVDLVDLRRAGDVLRREVLESGRLLFVVDSDELLEWEAVAMSRYARYREEVSGLIADFERTGVGYGQ